MNPHRLLRGLATALLAAALGSPALAGPGAHGPNGEHLDAPATTALPGLAYPRIEAHTDQFELVAMLTAGRLSLLIDRYASNEPLLGAAVEVESGGLKAKAAFHADIGDYTVTDEVLLKRLTRPGEHALVITVIAGQESDLLDATLKLTPEQARAALDALHGHAHDSADDHEAAPASSSRKLWTGLAVAAALAAAVAAWRRRAGAGSWKGGQA